MSSSGTGRPIRLVYCDENGKFQMDEAAVSFLKNIKGPIGVVSVCGPAHIGKSYIMNLLHGSSSGFKVGSSYEPCTRGLWVWSNPIRKTAEDGTQYSLLLIDSEGILQEEMYFCLAVHLSSMLIYNEMREIDDIALDSLSLVTKLADKHSDSASPSPNLVWLLRDWYLKLVGDNKKEITSREYLERALTPRRPEAAFVTDKIRKSIGALFPNRECFTLVRPVTDEDDLMHMDQISVDKLRPKFKSGLDKFKRFVLETTKPKYVQGTVMTGPIFVDFTNSLLLKMVKLLKSNFVKMKI